MSALIAAALSHSRTVLSILLLLLISGLYTYMTIPKEATPDITIPNIYVSVTLEGISPEDSVNMIVRPLETELKGIEGVKEMSATAYQGGANILLEFEAGFDSDAALDDVRESVDTAKADLPVDADEPIIREVNFSQFPILVVTLSGDIPERTLQRIARDLRDDIEQIPAVLSADLAGDREELVEVIIDPLIIESYGLNGNDIQTLFARNNRLVAAGELLGEQGQFPVKVPGLFETVQDIMKMPVLVGENSAITVDEVAEIRSTFVDPQSFARVNGERSIALEIVKRSGENVIDTIERVKDVVNYESQFWPNQLEVKFSQDRSKEIRTILSELQNNVISAILLVMIICVAALGLRTAGLVGLSIPGSFLIGILAIGLMGLTINNVVLFSLILAVGMLVDGAIVVTEYADRKLSEGCSNKEAFGLAAKRMSWPIIASTATTLAAFLPLIFWPGIVGEFMKYLPITLFATLISSLLMALIFVPTLGSVMPGRSSASAEMAQQLSGESSGDLHNLKGMSGHYVRLLEVALKRPGAILALSGVVLLAVYMFYATHGNGVEFFPEVEPERGQIHISARGNLSIFEKDEIVRSVEERLLDLDGVEQVYARVGGGSLGPFSNMPEDAIGTITLELMDWDMRPPADEIFAEARRRTADIPGIRVQTQKEESGPPVGKPVVIELTAENIDILLPAVEKISEHFLDDPDLIDIEDTRPLPGIEWEISVDRAEAAKYGVDVTAVGEGIKLVTSGLIIGDYRPIGTDEEVDIKLRYPEDMRSLSALDEVRLETNHGSVPISHFIDRSAKPKVGEISRRDSKPVFSVKADVTPEILPAEKILELQSWIENDAHLNPGIKVEFRGEDEEQREAADFLSKAFIVALFIMAIILITQFNSFYSAGLILSAVILSTIGVIIGLLITGQPFGIVMTGIGVIALAGIVVNNNIVLIDTYDRLRETAKDPREAVLRTGAQRLRPVMLTTITTILGLMPMTLSANIDFFSRTVSVGAPSTQWWTSMATAITFGLAFSTMLTLVVTPCALVIREDVKSWMGRKKRQACDLAFGSKNKQPANSMSQISSEAAE